jgi:hypothetical protein
MAFVPQPLPYQDVHIFKKNVALPFEQKKVKF